MPRGSAKVRVVASSPASVRVRARMSNSNDGVTIALTLASQPALGWTESGAGAQQHPTNGTPLEPWPFSRDTVPRKKAPISRAFPHSGGGIRTRDLRVMSPTSYQTAPPRVAPYVLAKNRTSERGSVAAHAASPRAPAPTFRITPVRVAVVDIGTNSTRLLIAEVDPGNGSMRELVSRSNVTRLGHGVDSSGSLSDGGHPARVRHARAVPQGDRLLRCPPTSPYSPPPCATPPTARSSPSAYARTTSSTRVSSPEMKRPSSRSSAP